LIAAMGRRIPFMDIGGRLFCLNEFSRGTV
jgi:hypothetical protein